LARRDAAAVGGERQRCGHRGKGDTCQVGVFRGYVSAHDHALLAFRLSTLPRCPHHWRFTPTECVPRLGKLLGSKAMMSLDSPNHSTTRPTNTVSNGR